MGELFRLPQNADYEADVAARVALTALPKSTPARLAWLLDQSSPEETVDRLRAGGFPGPTIDAPPGMANVLSQWFGAIHEVDEARLLEVERSLGHEVLTPLDADWPFAEEPYPPIVLFCRGNRSLLRRPGIAVVGTRRCTSVGRRVASSLGSDFARRSICVVSGLALGVDAAAHRGALESGGSVVGVVGTGLDTAYPRTNRGLWEQIAAEGLLASEYRAGTTAQRWRFPARNRLIAALSVATVVVESHNKGGALLTAGEAIDRGKPVFAVPGSVLSPASDGVNALLVDGAIPLRSGRDAAEYLGLSPPPSATSASEAEPGEQSVQVGMFFNSGAGSSPESSLHKLILAEVALGPVHIDTLVLQAGVPLPELFSEIQTMANAGLICLDGSTVVRPE